MNTSKTKILDFLKAYAVKNGECTPYMKEIAEAVGLKPPTVRKLISAMVHDGLIERQERWTEDGDYSFRDSNLYRVLIPVLLLFVALSLSPTRGIMFGIAAVLLLVQYFQPRRNAPAVRQ